MLAQTQAAMLERAREMGHADAASAVAAASPPGIPAGTRSSPRGPADAVAAAKAFVVSRDLVTLADGERLIVIPTPPYLRTVLPFAAYIPPGPFAAEQLGYY